VRVWREFGLYGGLIEERFSGTITARNGDYGACFEIFMPRG